MKKEKFLRFLRDNQCFPTGRQKGSLHSIRTVQTATRLLSRCTTILPSRGSRHL